MKRKNVRPTDLFESIDRGENDLQRDRIGLNERKNRRISRRKIVSVRIPIRQTLIERGGRFFCCRRLFDGILDQTFQQFDRIGMNGDNLSIGLSETFVFADVLTVDVDRMQLRMRMEMFDQTDAQSARGNENDLV